MKQAVSGRTTSETHSEARLWSARCTTAGAEVDAGRDANHEPRPLLVVSPHLDDAVLSCGMLLASQPGAVVCTALTGAPVEAMTTDWDRRSGFVDSLKAMQSRMAEDIRALARLRATPFHLPFCDAQYQSPPPREALGGALREVVRRLAPDSVMIPLGLFHSDHVLVADVCLASFQQIGGTPIYFYEDVPYRRIPGVLQERVTLLEQRGYVLSPADWLNTSASDNEKIKQAALDQYASQLRAFGNEGRAGLHSPERYWRLCDVRRKPDSEAAPAAARHTGC